MVLLLQVLLGVCLPAHQHTGAVASEAGDRRHQDPADNCPDNDSDHCSICLLARSLSAPADVRPFATHPELLYIASLPEPVSPDTVRTILPFFGRAPPAAT